MKDSVSLVAEDSAIDRKSVSKIVEFDTVAEKMAFMKGLTFQWDEKADIIAWAGHYDDTPNENAKYEWHLTVQQR